MAGDELLRLTAIKSGDAALSLHADVLGYADRRTTRRRDDEPVDSKHEQTVSQRRWLWNVQSDEKNKQYTTRLTPFDDAGVSTKRRAQQSSACEFGRWTFPRLFPGGGSRSKVKCSYPNPPEPRPLERGS